MEMKKFKAVFLKQENRIRTLESKVSELTGVPMKTTTTTNSNSTPEKSNTVSKFCSTLFYSKS